MTEVQTMVGGRGRRTWTTGDGPATHGLMLWYKVGPPDIKVWSEHEAPRDASAAFTPSATRVRRRLCTSLLSHDDFPGVRMRDSSYEKVAEAAATRTPFWNGYIGQHITARRGDCRRIRRTRERGSRAEQSRAEQSRAEQSRAQPHELRNSVHCSTAWERMQMQMQMQTQSQTQSHGIDRGTESAGPDAPGKRCFRRTRFLRCCTADTRQLQWPWRFAGRTGSSWTYYEKNKMMDQHPWTAMIYHPTSLHSHVAIFLRFPYLHHAPSSSAGVAVIPCLGGAGEGGGRWGLGAFASPTIAIYGGIYFFATAHGFPSQQAILLPAQARTANTQPNLTPTQLEGQAGLVPVSFLYLDPAASVLAFPLTTSFSPSRISHNSSNSPPPPFFAQTGTKPREAEIQTIDKMSNSDYYGSSGQQHGYGQQQPYYNPPPQQQQYPPQPAYNQQQSPYP
ncbi:hypothetical protein JHW43_007839, partial [Diplocarpon mali]